MSENEKAIGSGLVERLREAEELLDLAVQCDFEHPDGTGLTVEFQERYRAFKGDGGEWDATPRTDRLVGILEREPGLTHRELQERRSRAVKDAESEES